MDLKSNKNEVYAASRYFIGNVVKIRSNQEEIESNMKTGGEIIEYNVDTEGDRTGYNMETKENGTKNVSTSWRRRKKENKCTSRTRTYSADKT